MSNSPKKKERKVRAWAYVYKDFEANDEWMIDRYFARSFTEGFHAIFRTKTEAMRYPADGDNGKVIPVTIIYHV